MTTHSKMIDFIYLHGVKYHDEQKRIEFEQTVQSLHPILVKELSQNPTVQTQLLDEGRCQINPEPVAFFWGDQFNEEEQFSLNSLLNLTVAIRSKLLAGVQGLLGSMIRDGFWLAKPQNRRQVSMKLQDIIKRSTDKGHDVVILAHSAGTILTSYYFLYHTPYIDLYQSCQKRNRNPAITEWFKDPAHRYASIQALLESQIARLDQTGKPVFILDDVKIKDMAQLEQLHNTYIEEHMPALSQKSKDLDLPMDQFRGVIMFGSPITILFSESVSQFEGSMVQEFLKLYLQKEKFWLHINHALDPIGFPLKRSLTEQIQVFLSIFQLDDLLNSRGFVSNKLQYGQGGHWLNSHFWYFKNPKAFSKTVTEAFENGYHSWRNILNEVKENTQNNPIPVGTAKTPSTV